MSLSESQVQTVAQNIARDMVRSLTFEIKDGGFTDPNRITIALKLEGETIDTVSFSIKQQREYEG